jgi:hypothetical protein
MLYHQRSPRPDCQQCRDQRLGLPSYYADKGFCPSSAQPATSYERAAGNGTWARTTCPDCGRRVNVSRATKGCPWNLIARHQPLKANQPSANAS